MTRWPSRPRLATTLLCGDAAPALSVVDAMHEALYAGAQPQMLPRPRRLLCPGPMLWQAAAHPGVDRDEVLEVLNAHPAEVDQVLALWQGVTEELTAFTRAEAHGDERAVAWWRRRLFEDYGYVVGQASIIDADTLPWWQARMADHAGPSIDPKDVGA